MPVLLKHNRLFIYIEKKGVISFVNDGDNKHSVHFRHKKRPFLFGNHLSATNYLKNKKDDKRIKMLTLLQFFQVDIERGTVQIALCAVPSWTR